MTDPFERDALIRTRRGVRDAFQIKVIGCQTGVQSNFDPQTFSDVVSNQRKAANVAADKLRPSKPPSLQGRRMAPRVRRNKGTSYD